MILCILSHTINMICRHINPRDPLNLNLRKCFLQYDKDLSGTITADEVREVCKEMKISIEENTLKELLER